MPTLFGIQKSFKLKEFYTQDEQNGQIDSNIMPVVFYGRRFCYRSFVDARLDCYQRWRYENITIFLKEVPRISSKIKCVNYRYLIIFLLLFTPLCFFQNQDWVLMKLSYVLVYALNKKGVLDLGWHHS